MPTICTYFDDPAFNDYPFDDPEYVAAYSELAAAVHKLGGEFWIVRSPEHYKGKMRFSGGWRYANGTFIRENGTVRADVIYVKGRHLRYSSSDNVINPAGLDAACGMDKHRTYEIFPDLFPVTFEAETEEELRANIERLHAPTIVIKPVQGFGGKDVFIGPRKDAFADEHAYPVIAQEFVDTSQGIEGITPSYHDLRMIMLDGNIFLTCLRVPKQGELISNVSLGGSMSVIPAGMRPADVQPLIDEVDEKLNVFEHRYYSIDCGRDASGKWYIFELNDQPGMLTREECGEAADYYYGTLARYLIDRTAD